MDKYLIDSLSVIHDDREVIPYAMNSDTGASYHPLHDKSEIDKRVEHLSPLKLGLPDGEGNVRYVNIYMPSMMQEMTGLIAIIEGQRNLTIYQAGRIAELEVETGDLKALVEMLNDTEEPELSWWEKLWNR